MKAATRSEWKFWPQREDVTLRELVSAGAYADHALSAAGGAAKRRALTWQERAASAGAYTARNQVWIIPDEVLPDGVLPQAGWLVRDGDGIDHTILEVALGKWGNTHRCTTVALAVVNGLGDTGTLERPGNAQDAAGRMALSAYSTVGTSLCRVQPRDSDAGEALGRVTTAAKFTAYLATPLAARAKDRFTAGGVAYTVAGFRNPQRLDELQQLELEQIL
jgi:hypothetical protein